MSHISKNKLLDVAVEAAIASSNVIMGALNTPKKVSFKGRTDLVTTIDKDTSGRDVETVQKMLVQIRNSKHTQSDDRDLHAVSLDYSHLLGSYHNFKKNNKTKFLKNTNKVFLLQLQKQKD